MAKWIFAAYVCFTSFVASAQNIQGLPRIPTGGAGLGIRGSAGAGFADFKTHTPVADFRLERGTYVAAGLERGFNFLHLYLTFGFNYMNADGLANYDYSNLSSSTTHSQDDVDFKAQMYEVSLGVKMKLIDNYWFRPYVEGGGIGSYNVMTYTLNADSKNKDVIMGAGYYGEGGVEIQFGERFGVRLAARQAMVQTKKLETLGNRPVRLQNEIYYLSLLFGM